MIPRPGQNHPGHGTKRKLTNKHLFCKMLPASILCLYDSRGTDHAIGPGMQNDFSRVVVVPDDYLPSTPTCSPATSRLLCPEDTDVVDGVLRAFLTVCLVASLVICGMRPGAFRDADQKVNAQAHLVAGGPVCACVVPPRTSNL